MDWAVGWTVRDRFAGGADAIMIANRGSRLAVGRAVEAGLAGAAGAVAALGADVAVLRAGKAGLVAGYLLSKTGAGISKEGLSDAEWLEDKERARVGEALIKRYGCFGCHEIKGMEGLGKIGTE